MRSLFRPVIVAAGALLGAGCADRGVVSGPTASPGAATWVLVWVAAGLAIVVLGTLLARFQEPTIGGATFAAAVLALHAGAAVVGGAVLAGLAVRSGPFANAKAAGLPGSGTSLLPVSVIDGDPRFFTLMLVLVVLLSGALTFLLAVAARLARHDVPSERFAACAVLGLELVAATYSMARVLQGQRIWPYVLAAAHLPIIAVAIATCWPRPERGTTVSMAEVATRTDLFIGGHWRPAASGERFDVHDPGTEEVIATVANAGADDARAAAQAAADAQPGWAALAPRQRAEILRRSWELLTERADDLARLITLENGKVLAEAKGEITYAAEFFRWFSEEAVRLRGELTTAPGGANKILVLHQPVGVAYLVTPWNFPAAMATRKIAPALAAGCAVVLKPATLTPLTALAVADVLHEAGVPGGVVNVVPGSRARVITTAVLEHERVRKLSFTGSTEVGRLLIEQAAGRVLNVSMELGGNAPFIVLADADLDAAIEGAMIAKMRHNGETCTAANRFYVEAPVAVEFAAKLAEAMGALPTGHGLEPGNRLGPLVDAATRDKVAELVTSAVRVLGAEAAVGGTTPEGVGYYYPATVLTGVAPDNPILEEEIFGPVAPIVAVADADEAVRLANGTSMGLVSYVYTGDLAKGLRVAEALESGMVGLNKGIVSDPAAPFGGVKESGIGREGGHEGMLDYTETKYVATDW